MNKYFNFEIYTKDPLTLENGWDIEFVSVRANTFAGAKESLKCYPFFDEIILFNHSHELNEDADFLQYDGERNEVIVKRMSDNVIVLTENAKRKLDYIVGAGFIRSFPEDKPSMEWIGAVLDFFIETKLLIK